MSVRHEDILPAGVDSVQIGEINVRKGTIAAVIANLSVVDEVNSSEEAKVAAWATIEEYVPSLVALSLHNHVSWKNLRMQALVDAEVARRSN